MEETKEVGDIMIYQSFLIIIGLLFLLACVHLTLFHLDDVMNLGVVTNIEAVKNTLMYLPSSQLITPSPSLKNILTEVIHHDVTNLHGLPHLFVLAIHSVVDHQYRRP